MNKKSLAMATLLVLLTLALFSSINIVEANPTATNTVKLNLHNVSAQTLWAGHTTTTIMNTTSYWSSTTKTISKVLALNDTWYTLNLFYLWCKTAGILTIDTHTPNLELYLKANETLTSAVYVRSSLNKTTTAGTNTTIGVQSTQGSFSLSESYALKTISGPTFASDTTVEASMYISLKIELNTTLLAPTNITLAYDTATYPSRLELDCNDHITIDTVTVDKSDKLYQFDEPVVVSIAVSDDFGLYDVATIYQWFRPEDFASSIGTSKTATAPAGAGTSESNTGTWTATVIPNSISGADAYFNGEWVVWSGGTDNSGGTGGSEAGVRGGGNHASDDNSLSSVYIKYTTTGAEPPPEEVNATFWTQLLFGIPMYMWIAVTVVLCTMAVALVVFVKGSKGGKRR